MKVLLFLADGFALSEAGAFVDAMGWARSDFGLQVHLTTCGLRERVVSAFGVPVAVETQIDGVEAADYDALAIPGGLEEYGFYEAAYDARFLALLRAFDDAQKPISAICAAALPLGKSGILAGRRATTYHPDCNDQQMQLGEFGVQVIDAQVVIDENVITSQSPLKAFEVAFRLMEMLTSKAETAMVRESMGY